MTKMLRATVLGAVVAAMLFSPVFAHAAPPVLGVTVKPASVGGLQITNDPDPTSLAGLLGLKKGEILLTIGNPQENVPDMLLHTHKELKDALQHVGDHVRFLVLDPSKFPFTFSFVEGDLDDANPVSLQEEADTFLVDMKADKAKPKGPKEKVHKVKPRSVSQMLNKHKKPKKNQPRIVPGTVQRTPTHAPNWHPAAKGDKDKGKGKDKGKDKKGTRSVTDDGLRLTLPRQQRVI
jgi:hypothetical protein